MKRPTKKADPPIAAGPAMSSGPARVPGVDGQLYVAWFDGTSKMISGFKRSSRAQRGYEPMVRALVAAGAR